MILSSWLLWEGGVEESGCIEELLHLSLSRFVRSRSSLTCLQPAFHPAVPMKSAPRPELAAPQDVALINDEADGSLGFWHRSL